MLSNQKIGARIKVVLMVVTFSVFAQGDNQRLNDYEYGQHSHSYLQSYTQFLTSGAGSSDSGQSTEQLEALRREKSYLEGQISILRGRYTEIESRDTGISQDDLLKIQVARREMLSTKVELRRNVIEIRQELKKLEDSGRHGDRGGRNGPGRGGDRDDRFGHGNDGRRFDDPYDDDGFDDGFWGGDRWDRNDFEVHTRKLDMITRRTIGAINEASEMVSRKRIRFEAEMRGVDDNLRSARQDSTYTSNASQARLLGGQLEGKQNSLRSKDAELSALKSEKSSGRLSGEIAELQRRATQNQARVGELEKQSQVAQTQVRNIRAKGEPKSADGKNVDQLKRAVQVAEGRMKAAVAAYDRYYAPFDHRHGGSDTPTREQLLEIQRLNDAITTAQANWKSLKSAYSKLKDAGEAYKKQLEAAVARESEINRSLASVKSTIREQNESIATKKSRLANLDTLIGQYTKQVNDLRSEVQSLEGRVRQYSRAVEEYERSKIGPLEREKREILGDIDNLREWPRYLENSRRSLMELQSQLANRMQRMVALLIFIEEKSKQQDISISQELARLRAQIGDLESQLRIVESRISGLVNNPDKRTGDEELLNQVLGWETYLLQQYNLGIISINGGVR